jgi:hypothetical protein
MGPPFGGSLTGVMSNATTCGNHSGTKPNTIPEQAEKCSASARNPVRLQPGIVFGISPEPCSASPRNPVRLRPESADRTLAAIVSCPGHFDPMGIDTVKLGERALNVPQLIIAGGADNVSGTARPYDYFRKYRRQGAPWAFVIQNKSPHCCTANAKELILTWLAAVMEQRSPSSSRLGSVDQDGGWLTMFETQETDTTDSFQTRTFNATMASIKPVQHTDMQEQKDAG